MKIKVFPSMLSCDFANIKDELTKLASANADGLHLDIMDGHFVNNFSMGPDIVGAIRRNTNLFLDVHLMIYNPFDYIERFIEKGADKITFHLEATENVEYTLEYIKKCGKETGLAFNVETPVSLIVKYLDKCDSVTFMGVTPGFGGQDFNEKVLEKILFTRDLCKNLKIDLDILVDGGINTKTGKKCIENGANVLVSGSFLFSQNDMKQAISNLRDLSTTRP